MDYKYIPLSELKDNRIRAVKLNRIIDGDTIDFYIDQGFSQGFYDRARLYRLNTPEKRGTEAVAGKWVHQKVIDWVGEDTTLWLHSLVWDRDRYGRILADVYNQKGECLNAYLLLNNYAWPTDEIGTIIGQRDINRLKLPTEIINQVLISQRN